MPVDDTEQTALDQHPIASAHNLTKPSCGCVFEHENATQCHSTERVNLATGALETPAEKR